MPANRPLQTAGRVGLLLKYTCTASGRTAVVSEDEDSVWLYLTAPGSGRRERDCWLFNKPSAPPDPDMSTYRAQSAPPPAPASEILPGGVQEPAAPERWSFTWSARGDAVVVSVDGLPIGFSSMKQRRGLLRYLAQSGPWGETWDEGLVAEAIGEGG
jgi:hypothetical protein